MTPPTTGAPRWVLDTNVVLSALVQPGGTVGRLRLAWQKPLFIPLSSQITTAELLRVLAYPKFQLTADEQHDLLADYLPWVEAVQMPDVPPRAPVCRDPADVPFLELAFAARADALVTGDADLLVLSSMCDLSMITPADAIELLSA
jgi:putative PIN family toxin of toxin-antitoxin system